MSRAIFSSDKRRRPQQLLAALDLHIANLRLRRAIEQLAEIPLQPAPRHGEVVEHVLHGDAVAGPFANESQRGGDRRVAHGEHVGRLPDGDALRRHLDLQHRRRLALHHAIEPAGGFVADSLRIGDHARQRRIAQAAQQLVVVDADDRRLLGHGDIVAAAGVEHMLPAQVVGGKDAHRLRQRVQPLEQSRLILFPHLAVPARGDS